MMAQTGCDAVMVGRSAMGNPFIFYQMNELLAGRPVPAITATRRFALMRRYLQASVQYLGEKKACLMMRSRLGWFSRGLPQAGRFRNAIRHVETQQQALGMIADFEAQAYYDDLQE
jgi:tRNA-dihydrouridine synthase